MGISMTNTQQFIREKAEKLPHLFERLTMIEVTVDLSGELKHGRVRGAGGAQARLRRPRSGTPSLLAAVDLAMAKIEGQLRRYKEKIQDHRRTPSAGEVADRPRRKKPTEE